MNYANRYRSLSSKNRQRLLDSLGDLEGALRDLLAEIEADQHLTPVSEADPLLVPIGLIRSSLVEEPLLSSDPLLLLEEVHRLVDEYKVTGAGGNEVSLGEVLPNAPRRALDEAAFWFGGGRAYRSFRNAVARSIDDFGELILEQPRKLNIEWLIANAPDEVESYLDLERTLGEILVQIRGINDKNELEALLHEDDIQIIMAEIDTARVQAGNHRVRKHDAIAAKHWLEKLREIDHPLAQTITGLLQTGIGLFTLIASLR